MGKLPKNVAVSQAHPLDASTLAADRPTHTGGGVMDVHIYTARHQPATRWTDNNGPEPMTFEWPAGRLLWCRCCAKRHRASNCVVQAYYDGLSVWCAPNKGCKDPRVIAAKHRREFLNRSAGQKRRWNRRTPEQAE